MFKYVRYGIQLWWKIKSKFSFSFSISNLISVVLDGLGFRRIFFLQRIQFSNLRESGNFQNWHFEPEVSKGK